MEIPTYSLVMAYPVYHTPMGSISHRFNPLHMRKSRNKYTGVAHRTRMNYLRIALSLAGVSTSHEKVFDLIVRVFDGVEELKGDFTVRDAVRIQETVEEIYRKKEKLEKLKK